MMQKKKGLKIYAIDVVSEQGDFFKLLVEQAELGKAQTIV